MRRTWTIIGVKDVASSCRWYQTLLGLPHTAPAPDYFGQIVDTDGTVLLCLHEWGSHEHRSLMDPARAEPGNGLLLFIRVIDYDTSLANAGVSMSILRKSQTSTRIPEQWNSHFETRTDTMSR